MQTSATLSTVRLTASPFTARRNGAVGGAGTPLAEVEALLAAKGQRLAFEPPISAPFTARPARRPSAQSPLPTCPVPAGSSPGRRAMA